MHLVGLKVQPTIHQTNHQTIVPDSSRRPEGAEGGSAERGEANAVPSPLDVGRLGRVGRRAADHALQVHAAPRLHEHVAVAEDAHARDWKHGSV